jgi:hypothetical protein
MAFRTVGALFAGAGHLVTWIDRYRTRIANKQSEIFKLSSSTLRVTSVSFGLKENNI